MKFENLPQKIANQERAAARLREQLRTLKDAIAREESVIDKQVAFDSELKNDAQRKARRAELADQSALLKDLRNSIGRSEGQLKDAEIELELMRNTFSVLKLERREQIAQLELQAHTAA
jgi:archaellum component FlaC